MRNTDYRVLFSHNRIENNGAKAVSHGDEPSAVSHQQSKTLKAYR